MQKKTKKRAVSLRSRLNKAMKEARDWELATDAARKEREQLKADVSRGVEIEKALRESLRSKDKELHATIDALKIKLFDAEVRNSNLAGYLTRCRETDIASAPQKTIKDGEGKEISVSVWPHNGCQPLETDSGVSVNTRDEYDAPYGRSPGLPRSLKHFVTL